MGKFYSYHCKMMYNGREFSLGVIKPYVYTNDPTDTTMTFSTFDELYNYLMQHHIPRCYLDYTLFHHRRKIVVTDIAKFYEDKSFTPLMFCFYYDTWASVPRLQDMARYLDADEFAEWCKDKDLKICSKD